MLDVDHTKDLRKYTQDVDGKAVAGLVKHLGIALKSRDSSFVACSDKSERDRVREHFLKKKFWWGSCARIFGGLAGARRGVERPAGALF